MSSAVAAPTVQRMVERWKKLPSKAFAHLATRLWPVVASIGRLEILPVDHCRERVLRVDAQDPQLLCRTLRQVPHRTPSGYRSRWLLAMKRLVGPHRVFIGQVGQESEGLSTGRVGQEVSRGPDIVLSAWHLAS